MRNLEQIRKQLQVYKPELMKRYGLSQLAVFGSYARNQQTSESDLDILVEFDRPIGIAFIDLADELERILTLKVDLVSRGGIKESHFKAIEEELQYV
jgi:predicted nucleotidyltransferase